MNFKKPFKLNNVSNIFGEALSDDDVSKLSKAFQRNVGNQKVNGRPAEQAWVEMALYLMADKLEVEFGQLVQAFFTGDKGAMAFLNTINHNRAKYNAAAAEHNAKYPNTPEEHWKIKEYWDLGALKTFWHHQWANFASSLAMKSDNRQEYAVRQKKVPAPAKEHTGGSPAASSRKPAMATGVTVEVRGSKKKLLSLGN